MLGANRRDELSHGKPGVFWWENVVSVKRSWLLEGDDDSVRLLALQPHQIVGTVDPRTPIRALLGSELPRGPQRRAKTCRIALEAKLRDPEFVRLVNDRLAPAELN